MDVSDKNFNAATINMFNEHKNTMSKELKKGMMTMSHQAEKNK